MISYAVQQGNMVYVYDERNVMIANKEGELQGFTSTTFVVKKGRQINVFDEKCRILRTVFV